MNIEKKKFEKISRLVFRASKNLILRIHVKLFNEWGGKKNNFHSVFTTEDGQSYLSLDLQSFLTLEIRDEREWSPHKTIVINQRNINEIIKGMKKSLDAIYNDNIFAFNTNDEIIAYSDKVKQHTVKLFNIGNNSRLVIQPAVIFDEDEQITYEGVVIYFNSTKNRVELTIQAFEALYHTLDKIDIFVYSQTLINFYINFINKVEVTETEVAKKPKKRKHLLENIDREEVISTVSKNNKEVEDFLNIPSSK